MSLGRCSVLVMPHSKRLLRYDALGWDTYNSIKI